MKFDQPPSNISPQESAGVIESNEKYVIALYHHTDQENLVLDFNRGVWFSTSSDTVDAAHHKTNSGKHVKMFLSTKNAKLIESYKLLQYRDYRNNKVKWLRENGYDGVIDDRYGNGDVQHYFIVNQNVVANTRGEAENLPEIERAKVSTKRQIKNWLHSI